MKQFHYVCAAFLMVALTGCQNELVDPGDDSRTISFFLEEVATRTEFTIPSGTSYPVIWTGNESGIFISLNGGQPLESNISVEQNGRTARFSAAFDLSVGGDNTFYAVSPSSALNELSDGEWKVYIPEWQTPLTNSVDETAQLLFSKSETYSIVPEQVHLQFKHLTAYGLFSIRNLDIQEESISSIEIRSNLSLAGGFACDMSTGEPRPMEKASGTIHLVTSNTEGIWFACAPCDLGGQSLEFIVHTGTGSYSRTVSFADGRRFEAGKVARFTIDMSEAVFEAGSYCDFKTKDHVYIYDEEQSSCFSAIDSLTLRVSGLPEADSPEAGDIIICQVTSTLPEGFFGRVDSIGDDGTLHCSWATLEDAFDELHISAEDIDIAPYLTGFEDENGEVCESQIIDAHEFWEGLNYVTDTTNVAPSLARKKAPFANSDRFTLDLSIGNDFVQGHLLTELGYSLRIDLSGGHVRYLYFELDRRAALKAELRIETGGGFDLPLMKPVENQLGPGFVVPSPIGIPILRLIPSLTLSSGIRFKGAAKLSGSCTLELENTKYISVFKDGQFHSHTVDLRNESFVTAAELELKASITPHFDADLALAVWSRRLFSIGLEGEAYVSLEANHPFSLGDQYLLEYNPTLTLTPGISVKAFMTSDLFWGGDDNGSSFGGVNGTELGAELTLEFHSTKIPLLPQFYNCHMKGSYTDAGIKTVTSDIGLKALMKTSEKGIAFFKNGKDEPLAYCPVSSASAHNTTISYNGEVDYARPYCKEEPANTSAKCFFGDKIFLDPGIVSATFYATKSSYDSFHDISHLEVHYDAEARFPETDDQDDYYYGLYCVGADGNYYAIDYHRGSEQILSIEDKYLSVISDAPGHSPFGLSLEQAHIDYNAMKLTMSFTIGAFREKKGGNPNMGFLTMPDFRFIEGADIIFGEPVEVEIVYDEIPSIDLMRADDPYFENGPEYNPYAEYPEYRPDPDTIIRWNDCIGTFQWTDPTYATQYYPLELWFTAPMSCDFQITAKCNHTMWDEEVFWVETIQNPFSDAMHELPLDPIGLSSVGKDHYGPESGVFIHEKGKGQFYADNLRVIVCGSDQIGERYNDVYFYYYEEAYPCMKLRNGDVIVSPHKVTFDYCNENPIFFPEAIDEPFLLDDEGYKEAQNRYLQFLLSLLRRQ